VIKRILTAVAIASLAVLTASCSSESTSNTNANANASDVATTTTAPDNSEITVKNENGVRTETRTFRNKSAGLEGCGDYARRSSHRQSVFAQRRRARNEGDTERALDATGDAIADSAGWVKDKSVDVVKRQSMSRKTLPTRPKKEPRPSRTRPSIPARRSQ
jgi:hypothetical protein